MPVTMLIIVHDNTIEIIPSTRDAIANPAGSCGGTFLYAS